MRVRDLLRHGRSLGALGVTASAVVLPLVVIAASARSIPERSSDPTATECATTLACSTAQITRLGIPDRFEFVRAMERGRGQKITAGFDRWPTSKGSSSSSAHTTGAQRDRGLQRLMLRSSPGPNTASRSHSARHPTRSTTPVRRSGLRISRSWATTRTRNGRLTRRAVEVLSSRRKESASTFLSPLSVTVQQWKEVRPVSGDENMRYTYRLRMSNTAHRALLSEWDKCRWV